MRRTYIWVVCCEGIDYADPPHRPARLRPRREWPRRRAAKECHEPASFQLFKLHPLPLSRATAYRIGRRQVRASLAVRDFNPTYVSLGS